MPSSIFSSEYRPVCAFAAVFLVLVGVWELVIRAHYNPPLDVFSAPRIVAPATAAREWMVFGNCLVKNGISPASMESTWRGRLGHAPALPVVFNISRHEFSPLAYFRYLEAKGRYPDVIMANVSSWLNGTNYEIEADQLLAEDPLAMLEAGRGADRAEGIEGKAISMSAAVEDHLSRLLDGWLKQSEKRYHLFDYAAFAGKLVTTADLGDSLYQLGLQSWFKVGGAVTDSRGYMGLRVSYSPDWERGQDVMAEKQILRIRAGNFLTERYWARLEAYVREFQARGTRIVLMRMPEHPSIRVLNDEYYGMPARLADIALRNQVEVVDFRDTLKTEVRLFDAVHPDHPSAMAISGALATWVLERHAEWLKGQR